MRRVLNRMIFAATLTYSSLWLAGCGSAPSESSKVMADGIEGTPCGVENGIQVYCATNRVRTYAIRPDTMKNFTHCGKLQDAAGYAADKYEGTFEPYFKAQCKDQTYPKDENLNKFLVYGPYIALPGPGSLLVTFHISPQEVVTLYPQDWPTPDTAVFKVEIYSASLGGTVKQEIYRLSDFTGKMPPFALRFFTTGRESWLAKGKSFPDKIPMGVPGRYFPWAPVNWKALELGASIPSAITDLEVRVQILHGEANPSLLGIDVKYTKD